MSKTLRDLHESDEDEDSGEVELEEVPATITPPAGDYDMYISGPSDADPMDVEPYEERRKREYIQKCVDPYRKPPVKMDAFMKRCVKLARKGGYTIGATRHCIKEHMVKVWGWRDLSNAAVFGSAYAMIPLQLESRGRTVFVTDLVPVTEREADAYMRGQLDVSPRIRDHAQAQLDLISWGGAVPAYVPPALNKVWINDLGDEECEDMLKSLFEVQHNRRVNLGIMPEFVQYTHQDPNNEIAFSVMYN
jgi:hypothetical protein